VGFAVGSAVGSAVGVTSLVGSAVAVGSGVVSVSSGVGVPVSKIPVFKSSSPFLLQAASTKVNTIRQSTNNNLALFMLISLFHFFKNR
jgi:hypothetical protein